MYQDAAERLQDEVRKTIGEIDRGYLRRLQGDMHRCAARCCEDVNLPHERFQKCVDNCGVKIHAAQNFIRGELDDFQDRLNRCHMACNDKIRDKMSPNPTPSEMEKYRGELDKCANKCAEAHLEVLSQIFNRTKEYLKRIDFQTDKT